jgi:predicted transcriptional regulator|tara:strand:- start:572 stop:763 length:192 start_codon:yes stop_codon:yes gene_type:complete
MLHAIDLIKGIEKNTIKEKCKDVGINPSTYYRWLKGKYEPRAETARKIYNALSSQKKERQILE